MTYFNFRSILPAVLAVLSAFSASADVTVDGLVFADNGTLKGITSDIALDVVIPATVNVDESIISVKNWDNDCLVPDSKKGIPADRIKSIKSEDGEGSLTVWGYSIHDWTELKTIEFPVQMTDYYLDAIYNCPKLESITFRSETVVTFNYPEDTDYIIGSNPILYVPEKLVKEYKDLINSNDANAKAFLSQCSDIVAINGSEVPAGVHIVVDDMHLNVMDAKPGHKISIEAPDGEEIKSISLNGTPVEVTDNSKTQITLPDFLHHLVMNVDLTSAWQTSKIDVDIPESCVHGMPEGIHINNYDGSEVIVIDLSGRTVARAHRSFIPVAEGIYIVFYANKGHKILVRK